MTDLITIGLNIAGSTSTQIDANSEGKDRNINTSLRHGALVDASDFYFWMMVLHLGMIIHLSMG
ncbi:TonB-dependent receptor [Winogradskyella psychrotolerans RS-3]|uniref:TonB-dependent receptor n=1 Tax=Winogradskyella psychrotolerans RS-3 TaxID=641526 RepID=S7WUL0_9FLAO|nr:TonB-dependent receptor [Winogradskyella psychrotolerans RS-3]